jgi:hypothetical protein
LRILVVDGSPSCRLTVATADSAGDCIDRVELIETTREELDQHTSDTWDLTITHVREPGIDHISLSYPALGSVSRTSSGEQVDPSAPLRAAIFGRIGIFGRLFRRTKLSPYERQERHATRSVVLAEIQREIGIALSAIEMGDFDTIGEIALRLKDDGAVYNFAKLSGLGAALYDTVPNRDIRTARNIAQKLMSYMGKTIGTYTA